MLVSDLMVQVCFGIFSICCIIVLRCGCRSKLRMFFLVLICVIYLCIVRVKNVVQIWLYSVFIFGIVDLDFCCKNGIVFFSQLYFMLWLIGVKNSVFGKDVKK